MIILPSKKFINVASGAFTLANSRLSLVDGTAFFDCGADLSAYAGLDTGSHEYLIKVYDDDGYSIQGYVGAVGGGLAYGSELHTDANAASDPNGNEADFTTGWAGLNTTTLSSENTDPQTGTYHFKLLNTAISRLTASYDLTTEVGKLYKASGWMQAPTGAGISIGTQARVYVLTSGAVTRVTIGALDTWYLLEVSFVAEAVISDPQFSMQDAEADTDFVYADNISFKAYTDCAATGFHIISAQGGSTQNWTSESASFNYNDEDGYSYKIYKVR